jgi:Flp pilus assembly protein TadD
VSATLFLSFSQTLAGDGTAAASPSLTSRKRLVSYLTKDWLRLIALASAAILVHAPALQGERIWDDTSLTRDNPLIKSPLLILETFRHFLFLDSFSAHYRPMQNISYMVDYFFWNTDTWGFHITNVLLHAGSGVALYLLLRELFASLVFRHVSIGPRSKLKRRVPWLSTAAFCGAMIWVVHPVHSAAVDYISGRADSLAFLFAALAWLLFLRAQRETRSLRRIVIYFLAASSGLLSLLSREIGFVWFALFLIHLFWIEKHLRLPIRLSAAASCGVVIAVYLGLRQLPEHRHEFSADQGCSIPARATLMLRSLGDYGRLLVLPTNLHMDRTVAVPSMSRSNATALRADGLDYLSVLGLLTLATLAHGTFRKGHGQTVRGFGAIWFLAGYLPVSNVIQLNATIAEHWLYLPSVGFLIFVLGWAIELPEKYRHAILTCASIALLAFGGRSFIRSSDWINAGTFYERTLAAGGTSPRMAANLGHIYAARGNDCAAEEMYRRALRIAPSYSVALNNLANLLVRKGRKAEAETLFQKAVISAAKAPTDSSHVWMTAVNYAEFQRQAGDYKAALSVVENVHAANPDVWELVSYESELLCGTRDRAAALQIVNDFARANWWHYGAALASGRLYAENGNLDLAEAALRHASRLDVHDAEALSLIAQIRVRQNRFEDAYRIQRQAISRQPDEPRQYILLSNILDKLGRTDEARAALAQVSRLLELAKSESVAD